MSLPATDATTASGACAKTDAAMKITTSVRSILREDWKNIFQNSVVDLVGEGNVV
jgi:hypothetical protein